MELEFTAEQEELRDGVRAMLSRECPMSLVRAVVEDGAPRDGALERRWSSSAGPRSRPGGRRRARASGAVELAVVVEELGRVLGTRAVRADGDAVRARGPRSSGSPISRQRFLGRDRCTATLTGTLAITEPGGGHRPEHRRDDRDTRSSGGWQLDGRKTGVLGAAEADEIAVVARVGEGDDGVGRVRRPAGRDVVIEPIEALDGDPIPRQRRARRGRRCRRTACSATPGTQPCEASAVRSRRRRSALALETVGACQTIFDITLEYAKQREQFGVPIGSFQAIKHKLADMLVAVERARATGYFAALTIAEDDDRRATATATAKIAAADCQRLLAKEGHPDPRRHRVHVGARHAPVRAPREDERAAARHRGRAPRARRRPAPGL